MFRDLKFAVVFVRGVKKKKHVIDPKIKKKSRKLFGFSKGNFEIVNDLDS